MLRVALAHGGRGSRRLCRRLSPIRRAGFPSSCPIRRVQRRGTPLLGESAGKATQALILDGKQFASASTPMRSGSLRR